MFKKVDVKNQAHLIATCYKRGWLGKERDLSNREAALVEREEECDEWPEVTPAQKAYLAEFDRFLLAPSGSMAEARARASQSRTCSAQCTSRRG